MIARILSVLVIVVCTCQINYTSISTNSKANSGVSRLQYGLAILSPSAVTPQCGGGDCACSCNCSKRCEEGRPICDGGGHCCGSTCGPDDYQGCLSGCCDSIPNPCDGGGRVPDSD